MTGYKDVASVPFETGVVNYKDQRNSFHAAFAYNNHASPDAIYDELKDNITYGESRITPMFIKKAYKSILPRLPEDPVTMRERFLSETRFDEDKALLLV